MTAKYYTTCWFACVLARCTFAALSVFRTISFIQALLVLLDDTQRIWMTLPETSEGWGVVFISIHSQIASRLIRLRFETLFDFSRDQSGLPTKWCVVISANFAE